jgi:hypothetical protein
MKKVYMVETDKTIPELGITESELNAFLTISPNIKSSENITLFSLSPENHDTHHLTTLNKLIAMQLAAIQVDDLQYIEQLLYSQALSLDAVFNNMLRRTAYSQQIDQTQIFCQIALKAQNECRRTLATLAEIRNPRKSTFIKQQNCAVNQKVNNQFQPESFETPANELLSENNHETLDYRRTDQTIPANSQMDAMEAINGSKDTHRKKQM